MPIGADNGCDDNIPPLGRIFLGCTESLELAAATLTCGRNRCQNCRAIVLSWKLRDGVALESVTLETLSQDVVIGLMGLSLELA